MSSSEAYMETLRQLRDNILLISIANAHLCEETYLVKIGKEMAALVPRLKEGILALKKEYPGKFREEVNTDELLENIQAAAQTMEDSGSDVIEKCVLGELGRELESDFKSITEAVNLIRAQVEGKGHVYSTKDQISGIGDSVGNIWDSLGSFFIPVLKIVGCVVVIALIAFFYFFFTMERESSLRKEISASEAHISAQQSIIAQLGDEREQVQNDINDIEKGRLARQEKISILDLEMKIHKIEDDQHKAQTEIKSHEDLIAENKRKIKEIENKSFIERLLRQ